MIVEVSARARAELALAIDYLLDESPRAAQLVNTAIENAIDSLADMPRRGRRGRIANTRELVVRTTPYILVYAVAETRVLVLSIRHKRRGRGSEGA